MFCGGGSGGVGAATAVAAAAAGGGGGGGGGVLMLKALSLALTSAVIRVLRNTSAVIRNGSITEEYE
jgi:hypothetical protein